jgi:hypothetical protein
MQEGETFRRAASFAAILNNLAELYRTQGRYGEAELLYKSVYLTQEIVETAIDVAQRLATPFEPKADREMKAAA